VVTPQNNIYSGRFHYFSKVQQHERVTSANSTYLKYQRHGSGINIISCTNRLQRNVTNLFSIRSSAESELEVICSEFSQAGSNEKVVVCREMGHDRQHATASSTESADVSRLV
jgi:hypothetical protein